MGFSCGIVGLPNVGKTTIFNALTASAAAAENYPFCTVEPNHGIVTVPDERLEKVAAIFAPEKVTPTTIEFVDIAGLVDGASRGEGLGNQFLAQIREVDAIAHVVRCFTGGDVTHNYGSIDPVRDIQVVETELAIRDLDTVQKRLEKQRRASKSGDKAIGEEVEVLEKAERALAAGKAPAKAAPGESQDEALAALQLLTAKPAFCIANISDEQITTLGQDQPAALGEYCSSLDMPLVAVSARTEAELDELEPDERAEYMQEIGLSLRALPGVISAGYALLSLVTFFTTVGTEVRAWTVPAGTPARRAAGRIHTDMEKGFIRAEVIGATDLLEQGSEQAAREKGLIRSEGRDYVVEDGDVIRFRFKV